jgi:arsenical pump membrane protein
MLSTALISVAIFVFTLFLMIKQPRGINLGLAAGIGAVASLLLGTVTIDDAVFAFNDIWNAALAFVGIVTLSVTLDVMGFFKWAALRVVKMAKGSGLRLYFYVALLAAAVSILFANDSAVLILTPLVLEIVQQLKLEMKGKMAYLFAAGLIADTAAMPLITSNPVNIVSADFFRYTFIEHMVFMTPVAVVTIALSLVVVYLHFRKDIPKGYDPHLVDALIVDGAVIQPRQLKVSFITLVVIDALYVVASRNGVPVGFVIFGGAAFLLGFYVFTMSHSHMHEEEKHGVIYILKRVNWDILVFMAGILLVVQGLKHAGAIQFYADAFAWCLTLPSILSTLVPSLIVTVSASAMNNWPMTMLGLLSVEQATTSYALTSASQTVLIFANIIGNNLGPHFFPIGSLAILMWLNTMKQKGLNISLVDYLKVGSVLSIIEVFAAAVILWFEVYVLHWTLALA